MKDRVPQSSRRRFIQYLRDFRNRPRNELVSAHGKGKKSLTRNRSFLTLLGEFWRLLAGQRGTVLFSLATLTIATLLKLVPPASTKIIIDYVLIGNPLPASLPPNWAAWAKSFTPYQWIYILAGTTVLISLADTLLSLWGRWHATRATKRMQVSVRKRVFQHAVRLPLHRVYQLKSGGVASILREDAGGVADLIFGMLYNPWRAIIQFLGSVAVLAWVDWRLLLGASVLIPLVFFTHRTWVSRLRPLFGDIRLQREEVDGHATEAFGGMRVVRAFGRQRSESSRFVRGNHLMSRQELYSWWWSRGIELIWEISMPIASALLLIYGGTRVLQDSLTLGDLMMFLFYLGMLLGPMAVIATSATQFQSSLAALDRVLDLLAEPQEIVPPPQAVSVSAATIAGRISVRNASFRYPAGKDEVLKEINLEVEAGEMIAFVGPSGAGKTTLCNLIARFFDPTAGAVLLDGRDLREINLQSYRRLLGIVEQEVFLFDGTVAENIAYGSRTAGEADIQRAAELAHAHEFIANLEDGYDTRIGERGVRLSGGQRQRIAIARAVLADPRILILDEATSNLDSESERHIQEGLTTLMRGRTSFVIAHRLSTIRHANRIVVIDHGRILEIGTHQELLAKGGRYRDMVQLQLGAMATLT